MRKETLVKWAGFALILWALHLLARDFIFAFTHGTTEAAMGLTFLGLNSSQYSVLWTPFALLGFFGFAGVYVQDSSRVGNFGKLGFLVALVGLALSFIAAVMQFLILDVDRYFHSPLVYGGWLLSILSFFIFTAGFILAGIDIQNTNALPQGRSLILIIGVLSLPMAVLQAYIVQHSDGSLPWQLLYGGLSVPYDLCWLWLGYLLIAGTRNPTPGVYESSS